MRTTSLKKSIAALAAAVLSMGIGAIPALADPTAPSVTTYTTDSTTNAITNKADITLTGDTANGNSLKGRTFTYWRLLNYSTVDKSDEDKVVYQFITTDEDAANADKIKAAVKAGVAAVDSTKTSDTDVLDELGNIQSETTPSGGDAYKFAKAAYDKLITDKTAGTDKTCGDDDTATCVISGVQYGYYLIAEEVAASNNQSEPAQSYILLASLSDGTSGDKTDSGRSVTVKSRTPESHKVITTAENQQDLDNPNIAGGVPAISTSGATNDTKTPVFETGQTIWYTLEYTIPANYAQDFEDHQATFTYKLQDSLPKGLTYLGSPQLRVSTICGTSDSPKACTSDSTESRAVFTLDPSNSSPYSFPTAAPADLSDAGGSYYEWDVTVKPSTGDNKYTAKSGDTGDEPYQDMKYYLGKNNQSSSVQQDVTVYLSYKACMNGDAVVGKTGNANNYNVTYTKKAYGTSEGEWSHTPQESPKVYTAGALTLKKVNANNSSEALGGVTFCVTTDTNITKYNDCGGSSDKGHVTFFQPSSGDNNGVYMVKGTGNSSQKEATVTSDTNGEFKLGGLENNTTYRLFETGLGSNSDYVQKTDAWTIQITVNSTHDQNSKTGGAFTLDDKNHSYPNKDTSVNVAYNVSLDNAEATALSTTTVEITNTKRGQLPITGGQGIALAVIIGLGLVGIGAVVTKRSRKEDAAAE